MIEFFLSLFNRCSIVTLTNVQSNDFTFTIDISDIMYDFLRRTEKTTYSNGDTKWPLVAHLRWINKDPWDPETLCFLALFKTIVVGDNLRLLWRQVMNVTPIKKWTKSFTKKKVSFTFPLSLFCVIKLYDFVFVLFYGAHIAFWGFHPINNWHFYA